MSVPTLTHPTSTASPTSIHEDEFHSNHNNSHQQSSATNNSINSTQTRRYRDWIKRTQNIIDYRVATKKDAGWNPDLDYHIADIEEDLDRWDRFAQQRENLKMVEIKNEEAMDNGVKALISALSATVVAAIAVIYEPDKLAVATLVASFAPICVAIYFLTKSSRTRIQQHQDQVTKCLRESSIAARRKIKALSHQLHQQWNGDAHPNHGHGDGDGDGMRVRIPSIEERIHLHSSAVNRRDQSVTNDDNYLQQQPSISSVTDKHPTPPLRQTSSGETVPLPSMDHPERHSSKPYDDDDNHPQRHSSKPYDDDVLRKHFTLNKLNSYDGFNHAQMESNGRTSMADLHPHIHIDIHATADATAAADAANIPTRIHTSTPTPESQAED